MLGKIVHHLCKACALGRTNPFHTEAFTGHSQIIKHTEQQRHTTTRIIVAGRIMAVTGVTAAHDYTVRATLKARRIKSGFTLQEQGTLMILILAG